MFDYLKFYIRLFRLFLIFIWVLTRAIVATAWILSIRARLTKVGLANAWTLLLK